ncbi:hypothetical protein [Plantibacter flavus]|uniref:hypothetical protein n=1 Tax=Plantibacter flavus TaxID=150123 RepID=UPI000A1CD642|nr:hypothetical protein [Plantibacter flavus]
MKVVAPVRARSVVDIEVSGEDVEALRADVVALTPVGHQLVQVRGRGRVDGLLVGTASFRSVVVEMLEAEGPDYSAALARLMDLAGTERTVLSVRVA